jgi:type II secretory pathway component GspD/PulD (secretin)
MPALGISVGRIAPGVSLGVVVWGLIFGLVMQSRVGAEDPMPDGMAGTAELVSQHPIPFIDLPQPPPRNQKTTQTPVRLATFHSQPQSAQMPDPQAEESILQEPRRFEIPLQSVPYDEIGQVQTQDGMVTVNVKDVPLHSVLSLIAQQQGLSIASPTNLEARLSLTLQPTSLENALDAIMAITNCTWARHNDIIYVTQLVKESQDNFLIQGRMVQVFDLNYMSAQDAEKVASALVSPVGRVFARSLQSEDQRRTIEQLVVEDLPAYLARIAEFIARTDQPPKQVMVEVRILQIKLSNERRHGVNLEAMVHANNPEIMFKTDAFASSVGPAATFSVDGTQFTQLIDCLSSTVDSKTLAAPKLMMINGQESRIQIGQRLAYTTSTTTQTVTVEGVQFLDVGVVLSVTPHIADDGQILMRVQPKVSTGQINPNTELPEEETTELATSVMVPDGSGVIIGGLLQETNIERQIKIPWLGDVWLVGRLFQRRNIDRERAEVIVALLPRIVPNGRCDCTEGSQEMDRTLLPILKPDLAPAPRPEPALHDAINRPVGSLQGIFR